MTAAGTTGGGAAADAQPAGPLAAAPSTRGRGRLAVWALQLLVAVGVIVLWELAASARVVNPAIIGRPLEIARELVGFVGGAKIYGRTIYDHLLASLQVIAIGYALGAAAGIVVGFAFGRSRLLNRVFEPFILAVASVPKIAIAPLFVIVLGIGLASKVSIVFIEVFFMVFFSTIRGVFGVNEEYVNIARIIGASRLAVMRRVIIPAALPDILFGLRMGVPFAITGMVLGEFIASNQGLGWLILYSSSTLNPDGLWAALLFLVALTWVLSQLIVVVENRLLRWQPQRREGAMQV